MAGVLALLVVRVVAKVIIGNVFDMLQEDIRKLEDKLAQSSEKAER